MSYRIILEPLQDGGYQASVPDLPGCISAGNSAEEAARNIQQEIEAFFEASAEQQFSFNDLLSADG